MLQCAFIPHFGGKEFGDWLVDIGAHVEENRYAEVIVASAIAIGLFIFGVLFQDRLTHSLRQRHKALL